MGYYLGIDVGATKTHALIADEAGRCRGFGAAGPGSYQSIGYDGLARVLGEAFAGAAGAMSRLARLFRPSCANRPTRGY